MNRSEIIYRDVVLRQIPKDSMLQQFIQDLEPFILLAMIELAEQAYDTSTSITFDQWLNNEI